MSKQRRHGWSPHGLLSGLVVVFAAPALAQDADVIYSGGDIVTINDQQPTAEAVAIQGGKIIAVGPRAEVLRRRGPRTMMIDLRGRTMLPAFVDAHGHVSLTGFQAVSANLLPPPDGQGSSIANLRQLLRDHARRRSPRDTAVLIGFGYDDAQLTEKRHPVRQDLDAVSEDRPIIIYHQSAHLGVFNTEALRLAGITADTQNPEGGVIRREEDGRTPNGVLEEKAFFEATGKLVKPTLNEIITMLGAGQDLYARFGFTTGQDGRSDSGTNAVWASLAEQGRMKIDVVSYPDMTSQGALAVMSTPWHSRTYRNGFRIGGVKLSLDGSPQGKTAWLSQPYHHPPSDKPEDCCGYPALQDEQVREYVEQAYANDWQLLVHTNGDAAADQLLWAAELATDRHGAKDRRNVMIHAQTVREDQLDHMKTLGLIPSFFGMHTFYWGDWHREETLGPVRADRISPAMSAVRRGMRFTEHHDAPVAFPDAIRVISAAVTRRTRSNDILGPDQRVPVDLALKSVTLWAARQLCEEDSKGSIEVGKLADFVVLSRNPLKVDPEKLSTLKVLETIRRGQSIYRAPPK